MVPVNVREAANYRFYCDNDPQDVNGGTRWSLRPDPPYNQRGQNYVLNRLRQPWPIVQTGYQDWEDTINGVFIGRSRGCQDPGTQAETFTQGFAIQGETLPKAVISVSGCYL